MELLGQRVDVLDISIDTMKMPSKKAMPAWALTKSMCLWASVLNLCQSGSETW